MGSVTETGGGGPRNNSGRPRTLLKLILILLLIIQFLFSLLLFFYCRFDLSHSDKNTLKSVHFITLVSFFLQLSGAFIFLC